MFVLLVLQCYITTFAQRRRDVVINEINVIDPFKPEKREFIELKSTIPVPKGKTVALRGYKVVGISAGDNGAEIELVVQLWNAAIGEKGYYTIGGTAVPEANLKVPNDFIQFRQQLIGSSFSLFNMVNNGNKRLNAIGLLYAKESEKLSAFFLKGGQDVLKVDNDIKELLKKYLVDLVVYGKLDARERCNVYEYIYPDLIHKKRYALREFPLIRNDDDITLNRCTSEPNGFMPEKFKIGKATPNASNDCSGSHFILEDHILDVTTPLGHGYSSELTMDESAPEAGCSSRIAPSEYHSVTEERVSKILAEERKSNENDVCTARQLDPYGAEIVEDIERSNAKRRRISSDPDTNYEEEYEWETEKHFE